MQVILWDIHYPTLVIRGSTGVVYANQTGGICCEQSEIEGSLVPLDREDIDLSLGMLNDVWCTGDYILSTFGVKLNAILKTFTQAGRKIDLQLDIDTLCNSSDNWGEAWLPVLSVFGAGVLTWENSD